MRLTFEDSWDVSPVLASARATATVLVVTVPAVMPLRVPTSCFDLVQRSQFGDGLSLQELHEGKKKGNMYFQSPLLKIE